MEEGGGGGQRTRERERAEGGSNRGHTKAHGFLMVVLASGRLEVSLRLAHSHIVPMLRLRDVASARILAPYDVQFYNFNIQAKGQGCRLVLVQLTPKKPKNGITVLVCTMY